MITTVTICAYGNNMQRPRRSPQVDFNLQLLHAFSLIDFIAIIFILSLYVAFKPLNVENNRLTLNQQPYLWHVSADNANTITVSIYKKTHRYINTFS